MPTLFVTRVVPREKIMEQRRKVDDIEKQMMSVKGCSKRKKIIIGQTKLTFLTSILMWMDDGTRRKEKKKKKKKRKWSVNHFSYCILKWSPKKNNNKTNTRTDQCDHNHPFLRLGRIETTANAGRDNIPADQR